LADLEVAASMDPLGIVITEMIIEEVEEVVTGGMMIIEEVVVDTEVVGTTIVEVQVHFEVEEGKTTTVHVGITAEEVVVTCAVIF